MIVFDQSSAPDVRDNGHQVYGRPYQSVRGGVASRVVVGPQGEAHQPIRPLYLWGGVFGDFFDLDPQSDAGYEKPKSDPVSLSIQPDSWRFFLTPFFNASHICENSS